MEVVEYFNSLVGVLNVVPGLPARAVATHPLDQIQEL